MMREEPERIELLNQIARKMLASYHSLGFNTGGSESPITPIIIGDDMLTFMTWKMLFDNGVFFNPVISPAVPPGHQ
jgi:7-keto-8-aminopelargonate synthetase-like enzyme